jgi:hypothetical protein
MIAWREQLEAIINGESPNIIPAVLRLDKWYRARLHENNLPGELQGMSLDALQDHLGLARSARDAKVFTRRLGPSVEHVEQRKDDLTITEWRTSRGTLHKVQRSTAADAAAGLLPAIIEYPIKSAEDYAAFAEVAHHTEFVPCYEDCRRYDQEIGNTGLPMVILGPDPFHDILLNWTGYEQGYVDLHERPDLVREAVSASDASYRRMWPIIAESPARFVMHGVNFDTQMTPPPIFRQYFLPYLKQFNTEMHKAGKRVAFHADGDLTGLLSLVLEADFDAADCFACTPLVPCTVAQAREAWKGRITMWGGVPSTLLEPNIPLERLEAHLHGLYRDVAPGDHFILGLSDQAMPTSSWEHIRLMCKWAREHSGYPLGV